MEEAAEPGDLGTALLAHKKTDSLRQKEEITKANQKHALQELQHDHDVEMAQLQNSVKKAKFIEANRAYLCPSPAAEEKDTEDEDEGETDSSAEYSPMSSTN